MRSLVQLSVAVVGLVLCACQAPAVMIYVDKDRAPGPTTNGLSPATAWVTISDGAAHLANTNQYVQGGHTVQVEAASSDYAEEVDLTSSHDGLSSSVPNVFVSTNFATVDGEPRCFHLSDSDYIVIDGFNLHLASQGVYHDTTACLGFRIQNCNIYNNSSAGISIFYLGSADYTGTVQNCTIYGHYNSAGISLTQNNLDLKLFVKNCIIVNNAFAGIYDSNSNYTNLNVSAAYCDIYGNGIYEFWHGYTGVGSDTEIQLNNLAGWSNNIVRNPGFADTYNWNFEPVYDTSPCLNTGENGVDMGARQNPTEQTVSNNTYYVDDATGDDNDDGLTFADAWKTIGKAATVAAAGDTVKIEPATYAELVTITRGGSYNKPVTYEVNGAGTVSVRGFRIENVGDVTLDGLRLYAEGNRADFYQAYACTLSDMTIDGGDRGVNLNRSHRIIVEDSDIYGAGRNIWNDTRCSVTVRRSKIHHNNVPSYYAVHSASYNGFATLENCNIYSNLGSAVYYTSSHYKNFKKDRVENCVIFGNGRSGVEVWGNSLLVQNTIIAENGRHGIYEVGGGNDAYSTNNCFWANNQSAGAYFNFWDEGTTGYDDAASINVLLYSTNNIVANPLFATPLTNFTLETTSPCIDEGTTTTELNVDFFGNPRLVGAAVDIGSYEQQPGPASGTVITIR